MAKIVFHVGGPAFHPVDQQATQVIQWLGGRHACTVAEGTDAFEQLDSCDLLVLMGLHWTGMQPDLAYHPLQPAHEEAFTRYVASGRPVLAHHGAIASYDDCPRFGELVGFAWIWGTTSHSPVGDYLIRVLPTGHPVVRGVSDYRIHDELYYGVRVHPDLRPQTHAQVAWDGQERPMILTAEGGRIDGAGKVIYLANGHDLKAFECPAMKQLWLNSIAWLLE